MSESPIKQPTSMDAQPWWMKNGHLQTILPALTRASAGAMLEPKRERWTTPDDDFIEVDRLDGSNSAPVLVLLHGLEGSYESHYAQTFASEALRRNWSFLLPHFRGCGGALNTAPRAYHAGDHAEIDWILKRAKKVCGTRQLLVVGFSLGGNALMRWAGLRGNEARNLAAAIVAVSSPLNLTATGMAMGGGFNRYVYTRYFMYTMIRKALKKWDQFPGLFDRAMLRQAKTLYEFDNVFTAPLHGFLDADDYWFKASAFPLLPQVNVPSLLVNAQNDPFVPHWSLPNRSDVSAAVSLWQPKTGGHVGFPTACKKIPAWFETSHLSVAVLNWLESHVRDGRDLGEGAMHG